MIEPSDWAQHPSTIPDSSPEPNWMYHADIFPFVETADCLQFQSICWSHITEPTDETKFGVHHTSQSYLTNHSNQNIVIFGCHWAWNFALITALKPRWWNENFVRCIKVTHGWQIDWNWTVHSTSWLLICLFMMFARWAENLAILSTTFQSTTWSPTANLTQLWDECADCSSEIQEICTDLLF